MSTVLVSGPARRLRSIGTPIRGINVWLQTIERKATPMRLTFRQALELGANVSKGEHGSFAVYDPVR